MSGRRPNREQLRAAMTAAANQTRDTADEMARQYDGCDDSLHPHKVGVFRDWVDFVDRVARPIVETEDDAIEQEAMRLYRQASPYFICAALVMAVNRIKDAADPDGEPCGTCADAGWVGSRTDPTDCPTCGRKPYWLVGDGTYPAPPAADPASEPDTFTNGQCSLCGAPTPEPEKYDVCDECYAADPASGDTT